MKTRAIIALGLALAALAQGCCHHRTCCHRRPLYNRIHGPKYQRLHAAPAATCCHGGDVVGHDVGPLPGPPPLAE